MCDIGTINQATVKHIVHEPGNGTRYEVWATRLSELNWLVAAPDWRLTFIVTPESYISESYVQGKGGQTIGDADAIELARAVAAIVPMCEAP